MPMKIKVLSVYPVKKRTGLEHGWRVHSLNGRKTHIPGESFKGGPSHARRAAMSALDLEERMLKEMPTKADGTLRWKIDRAGWGATQPDLAAPDPCGTSALEAAATGL